jgi:hypothetical protein
MGISQTARCRAGQLAFTVYYTAATLLVTALLEVKGKGGVSSLVVIQT